MSELTAKSRLLNTIKGESTDRSPVICPGGMMNAAVEEIVFKSGVSLIEAHKDYKLMAKLAEAVRTETGFENFGLPFCMTVEAEVCGSSIDFGSNTCEPKIAKERFADTASVIVEDVDAIMEQGRIKTVALATKKLTEYYPDTPVIGTLTGPVSLAASVVDPMMFFRDLKRNPEGTHRLFEYVTNVIASYGELLVQNGASVIAIADPTATGDLLSPAMFEEYAVRYLRKVIDRIHRAGAPVIVHICGNVTIIRNELQKIGADVISVDAMVDLPKLKDHLPESKTMGNMSTFLLDSGRKDKIETNARWLMKKKIDIIAPACGLGMSTPVENIRALTQTVWNGQ